mgnify:CR=1 FL=1
MSCFLKYIHPKSLKKVKAWEKEFGVEITASKPSKTRLGVFIVKKHAPNIIKINNDLNKYSFLIILIHELAHASVWKKFGRQVNPHGKEWKHEFHQHSFHRYFHTALFP